MGKHNDNLEKVFEHELCSYPPALFESKWTPRLGCKATLADVLWKYMPEQMPAPEGMPHICTGWWCIAS